MVKAGGAVFAASINNSANRFLIGAGEGSGRGVAKMMVAVALNDTPIGFDGFGNGAHRHTSRVIAAEILRAITNLTVELVTVPAPLGVEPSQFSIEPVVQPDMQVVVILPGARNDQVGVGIAVFFN